MLYVLLLSVIYAECMCYAESCYAEFIYALCYAECHGAIKSDVTGWSVKTRNVCSCEQL